MERPTERMNLQLVLCKVIECYVIDIARVINVFMHVGD
jgi:hypothetical protein